MALPAPAFFVLELSWAAPPHGADPVIRNAGLKEVASAA